MVENCRVNSCQKRPLVAALESILDAEKEFREAMGEHWEGDPLSDACDQARKMLAAVGGVKHD
jgi:hypothetical protein